MVHSCCLLQPCGSCPQRPLSRNSCTWRCFTVWALSWKSYRCTSLLLLILLGSFFFPKSASPSEGVILGDSVALWDLWCMGSGLWEPASLHGAPCDLECCVWASTYGDRLWSYFMIKKKDTKNSIDLLAYSWVEWKFLFFIVSHSCSSLMPQGDNCEHHLLVLLSLSVLWSVCITPSNFLYTPIISWNRSTIFMYVTIPYRFSQARAHPSWCNQQLIWEQQSNMYIICLLNTSQSVTGLLICICVSLPYWGLSWLLLLLVWIFLKLFSVGQLSREMGITVIHWKKVTLYMISSYIQ